ncbi:MAG: hypothetical protein DA405_05995 [Bacteroidetes bacterium]|nr:MAG: hypothetical protein DA405_05995 [Bacteroidota bacterium]
MNRTSHFLVLFGFLPSLIACSNALAENTQVNETKAFLTISLDTNRIDNSKIVNPEGQLLLSFEAYPTFEHPISLVQLKSAKSLKAYNRVSRYRISFHNKCRVRGRKPSFRRILSA